MDQVNSDVSKEHRSQSDPAIIPPRPAVHADQEQEPDTGNAPRTKGQSPDNAKFGYWKQLLREKPDRLFELFLTLVIGFFAAVQLIVSCRNNDSTTLQNNQLIQASEIAALAARQNAQAARDFSTSARSINDGISDAVDRLNRQAAGTQGLVEEAGKQSANSKELADASKASVNIATSSLIDVQRADMIKSGTTWSPNDATNPRTFNMYVEWKNSGNTSTKNLRIWWNHEVRHVALKDPETLPDYDEKTKALPPMPFFLGRQETTFTLPAVLTLDETNAVFNHQLLIYFWGWARYNDIFPGTKPHITRYCFVVDGMTGDPLKAGTVPTNQDCQSDNCRDEECKVQ